MIIILNIGRVLLGRRKTEMKTFDQLDPDFPHIFGSHLQLLKHGYYTFLYLYLRIKGVRKI